MKDQDLIVVIDGNQSPAREFIFGANLARLLQIGTIRCIEPELKPEILGLHVALPGGSGEQTFSAGGCGVSFFDTRRSRLDSAHDSASRAKNLQRVARALGVCFGGYERTGFKLEIAADRRNTVLAAASLRSGSSLQQLIAPGASRVVFCPACPVAYQRIIVDASDPRLSDLLNWGFNWSRRLNVPVYLVAAESARERRVCRIPGLTHVFDWLELKAGLRTTQCNLAMLRNELRPADLLLTSTHGSIAEPISGFGCGLSEVLAGARCAVGVLPMERPVCESTGEDAPARDKYVLLDVTSSA